jgi:hypothetical protein
VYVEESHRELSGSDRLLESDLMVGYRLLKIFTKFVSLKPLNLSDLADLEADMICTKWE